MDEITDKREISADEDGAYLTQALCGITIRGNADDIKCQLNAALVPRYSVCSVQINLPEITVQLESQMHTVEIDLDFEFKQEAE